MKNPIVDNAWSANPGDAYMVNGVDANGMPIRKKFNSWGRARSIYVTSGCKWLVRGGKRFLIQRIGAKCTLLN